MSLILAVPLFWSLLTMNDNVLELPKESSNFTIFWVGFVNLFNVNNYNQDIDSILNNQKNCSSAAQKYKQVHLIMVKVLIRVLTSLWSTKPVFPLPARHWCLAVLSKLNMSKAKDTRSGTKLFTFLHPFIFLQSTPFLVFSFSVIGIPTHTSAPPDTWNSASLSFHQVLTPGIRPTNSHLGLALPSTAPGVDYFTSLLLFIWNTAIASLLVFLASVWSPSTHPRITFLKFKSHPILTPTSYKPSKTLHGFWHKCSFFLHRKLQDLSPTYPITHHSPTW